MSLEVEDGKVVNLNNETRDFPCQILIHYYI